MNKNAEGWVSELESGNWKQATEFLRSENGYCCLGVACEMYRKEHSENCYWSENENGSFTFYVGGVFAERELPEQVRDWLGLSDDVGTYGENSLAKRNDRGNSFQEIAEIIRSEPKGLFKE